MDTNFNLTESSRQSITTCTRSTQEGWFSSDLYQCQHRTVPRDKHYNSRGTRWQLLRVST